MRKTRNRKARPASAVARVLGALTVITMIVGGIVSGAVFMPATQHAWVDDQWIAPASADASSIAGCIYFQTPPAAFTANAASEVRCDANRMMYVDIGGGSVSITGGVTVTLPFSGSSDNQSPGAGQGVGLMLWDGTNWDRWTGSSGIANVAVPGGVTISGNPTVIQKPTSTAQDTVGQADFSSGGSNNSCQPIAVYPATPAITSNMTGGPCYIFKASAGVLLNMSWNSLSAMNTLAAGSAIVCYDNATTNSGRVVWQSFGGAGQYDHWEPYGRPFVNGLTCKANMTIPGGGGTNVLEALFV